MSIDIRPNPASAGSVTGGLVYKGSYDAALQTPNLVNSLKGDFYIVSDAGSLAGIALNIGDHIVFNQDASAPIISAMFDVIDNTDAVASVNGQTGVVTLSASNVSALAISNNLSDLNNTGTARTNLGLGSAATKSTGTSNGQVVLLDAVGLPAVDGSQLTNVTATDATKLAIANNLSDLNNAGTARTNLGVAIGSDVQAFDAQLTDVAGLTPADGAFIVGDGSNFVTETLGTARTSLGLGSAATEDVGTGANNVVQLDGSSRLPAVDGSQLTNVTATDATKLAIANNLSDLNNAGTARTNLGLGSAATKSTGTSNGQVVLLDAVGLPAVDGSQLTNVTGTDATKLAIANNLSDLNNAGTARTNLGVAIGSDVQAFDAQLTDVAGLTPADGAFIVGDGSNFVTETLGTARTSLGLGSAATKDVGTGANNVVQLDGSSRLPAVDGSQLTNITATDATKLAIANNLSDLNNAGTARTNLGVAIGSDVQAFDAQLTDVAGLTPADGAFIVGDGSNFVTETLGTARTSLGLGSAATEDVGTGANNVVQLDGSSRLPAVDGSQLTNVTATETDTLNDVVGRGATTSTPITIGDLKINSNAAGTSTSGSIATLASNNNIKLDPHGSGKPELVGNATRGSGQIQFNCEQNSHGIILKGPPHSAGASYTMILPDALGSNGQFLQLQDSSTGELTFSASGAGDLLASNNLSDLDNASTARTNLGVAIGTNVQAYDAQLADVAGLTPADGAFIVGDGSNFIVESLATARTSLGLGSAATLTAGTSANNVVQLDGSSRLPAVDGSQLTNLPSGSGDLLASNNLSDLDNASTARTNLGVAIGSDVQAYDAQLTDVAGLTPADGAFIVGDGSNFVTETLGTARTSLGLGSAATLTAGTSANNVVQLDGSARLPAVDGSQLTNLPGGGGGSVPNVTTDSSGTDSTISTSTGIEEVHLIDNGANAVTITIPSASTSGTGYKYNIKRLGTANVTIKTATPASDGQIDGEDTHILISQNESITIVSNNSNYFII